MHRSILIHQHGVWMNQWELRDIQDIITRIIMLLRKVRPHFRTRCWDSCTSKVVTNARQEKLWFQFSRWNTTRSAKYIYTIGFNPECKKMCSINWFYLLQRLRSSYVLYWKRENNWKIDAIPKEYLYLYLNIS